MEAIRLRQVVEVDGELRLTGVPVEKGQTIEVILLLESSTYVPPHFKLADLLDSELVGLWADRDDIGDSVEFARQLREQAETRLR